MIKKVLVFSLFILFTISCSNNVKTYQGKKETKILSFTYKGKAKSVFMAGNFNNWKVSDPRYKFTLKENDTWELTLPENYFLKGENEYKLIVDNEWVVDENAPEKRDTKLAGKIGLFKIE